MIITSLLKRDFYLCFSEKSTYLLLSIWSFFVYFSYFYLLDQYIAEQQIANSPIGNQTVYNALIKTYLSQITYPSAMIVSAICARLFYLERFAPFHLLYKTLCIRKEQIIISKYCYAAFVSLFITIAITLPVLVSYFYFDFDIYRVIVAMLGLFLFLWSFSIVALVISFYSSQSFFVFIATLIILLIPSILLKLSIYPAWTTRMIEQYNTIFHLRSLLNGEISIQNIGYYLSLILITYIITVRNHNNLKLQNV